MPRTKEQPHGFTDLFAGSEAVGCVVVTGEEKFANLAFEDVSRALTECGFDAEQVKALEVGLRQDLLP